MRNPFKAYWFIQCDRWQGGKQVSTHFRMFTTWRWTKPAVALHMAIDHMAKINQCMEEDLIATCFCRN